MILIIALLALGLFLSAFFSGSETGFYRITRVRLVLDAKSGKTIARFLLWLVSRPTFVVATVLIGNNIANYVVSFGLVLASESLFAAWGDTVQVVVPVLATPLLFIYGELLPKYLYYNAPYFLSTRGAPLMVFCSILFLPISIVVIGLEAVWQRLFAGELNRSKMSLERQELQRVMLEGQEVGILRPIQRELSQNLFTYGVRPIRQFAVPLRAIPSVKTGAERSEIIALAQRFNQRFVGVLGTSGKELIGCYSVADLIVTQEMPFMLPICQASVEDSSIQVLTKLQHEQSPIAQIVDAKGTVLGVVSQERLIALLMN